MNGARRTTQRAVGAEASDDALLSAMAEGDDLASVAFVRRFQRRVYGLAYSMVSDPSLAEDIAQEALLRAWRHAPVYDVRRGSVAAWLLTITRNLAIDALRIRRSAPFDPERVFEILGFDPAAEAAFGHADQSRTVREALDALPNEQRSAVVLSALYGYTAEEIGTAQQIPIGTAKSRIRAGLQKLNVALSSTEDRP